jgi:four helix bundle protein
MNGYRDLEIYQISKELALVLHRMTLTLPKHELYEEGSQTRRSSKAVTTLIVEGFARRKYVSDYIKYLTYSQAECDETKVHLTFLFESGSWRDEAAYRDLSDKYTALSKKIMHFIEWVETNGKPNSRHQRGRLG